MEFVSPVTPQSTAVKMSLSLYMLSIIKSPWLSIILFLGTAFCLKRLQGFSREILCWYPEAFFYIELDTVDAKIDFVASVMPLVCFITNKSTTYTDVIGSFSKRAENCQVLRLSKSPSANQR